MRINCLVVIVALPGIIMVSITNTAVNYCVRLATLQERLVDKIMILQNMETPLQCFAIHLS